MNPHWIKRERIERGFAMKRKVVLVVAAVALLAAGCGSGEGSAAGIAGMARPLAYSLTGDVELSYHGDMDMEMTTTFGDEITSVDPSMPSTMLTKMDMSFDTTYRVESGSEPGTYRVTMILDDIDINDGEVEMGGYSVDLSDMPQSEIDAAMAAQMPEFVYVIDEKGSVLSVEMDGTVIDVEGLLGGTSTAGIGGGQMWGPELPDGVVGVGDSWTTSSEEVIGDVAIVTEATHQILRAEGRSGYDTWVIRTDATTDGYTINWDDMIAMFEDRGGIAEVEGMEGMPPSFQMAIRSAPTKTTSYTWLEPNLGQAVATEVMVNMSMTMEMGGIPGMTGSFSMDMDGYTSLVLELNS